MIPQAAPAHFKLDVVYRRRQYSTHPRQLANDTTFLLFICFKASYRILKVLKPAASLWQWCTVVCPSVATGTAIGQKTAQNVASAEYARLGRIYALAVLEPLPASSSNSVATNELGRSHVASQYELEPGRSQLCLMHVRISITFIRRFSWVHPRGRHHTSCLISAACYLLPLFFTTNALCPVNI